ncbi:MAG TPA: hypothetical protein VNK04_08175 [Gemmataceae bacterium]|nr:hypothetical protein [Gemmataceae bacterium]
MLVAAYRKLVQGRWKVAILGTLAALMLAPSVGFALTAEQIQQISNLQDQLLEEGIARQRAQLRARISRLPPRLRVTQGRRLIRRFNRRAELVRQQLQQQQSASPFQINFVVPRI